MFARHAAVGLCAGVMLGWAVAVAAQTVYQGRLSAVPIEIATQAQTTGSGSVRAELDGNRLTVSGSFSGLSGSATTAAIHLGPVRGVRGPAVHALEVSKNRSGQVSGTVRLSRDQLDGLEAGRLYVQIESAAAPEGNLWGWLFD
jgi:hypothetical protein